MKLEDVSAKALTDMAEWVKTTSATVGKASGVVFDWASTQIPDVIRQFLMWRAVEAGLWMALGAFLSLLAVTVVILVGKKTEWEEDATSTACLVALGLGIPGFIMFCSNAFTVAQIWVAPKVYLIEQMAELVKKARG